MKVRTGNIDDLAELQQLFVDTVTEVCTHDYNDEQISVWASGVENKLRWQNILTHQFIAVAQENEKITGFCTLEDGSYIDLLFVHKNYQRQGIGNRLYESIEIEAKRGGRTELTADVSKTAKKFFQQLGFSVIEEQTVNIKGVELTNYKMKKRMD